MPPTPRSGWRASLCRTLEAYRALENNDIAGKIVVDTREQAWPWLAKGQATSPRAWNFSVPAPFYSPVAAETPSGKKI
jgi:hypothetical protein